MNVVRNEVTTAMAIAGACVIGGWLDDDPDYRKQAANHSDLACLVFAAIRREQT
jgi:hypothetical protein